MTQRATAGTNPALPCAAFSGFEGLVERTLEFFYAKVCNTNSSRVGYRCISACRVQAAAMAGVYKLEITETEADLKQ
jgi:hypothetical protein